jgi:hypothetical protein
MRSKLKTFALSILTVPQEKNSFGTRYIKTDRGSQQDLDIRGFAVLA